MKWFWGLLIIAIGVLLLALNLQVISAEQLSRLTQFWPLLIILFGLALIFRQWRFGWIIIILFFIVSGLLIYNLVFSANPVIQTDHLSINRASSAKFSADLSPNIKRINLTVRTGAVNLNISGNSTKMIEGDLRSSVMHPELSVQTRNDEAFITLETPADNRIVFSGRNDLTINLTNKVPIEITLNSGASAERLDLTNVNLSGLNINTGASSLDISLGNSIATTTPVTIKAGVSDIKIDYPTALAAQIITDSALSSRDFPGFTKINNNTYQTSNYSAAAKKINFDIKAGVSSLSVRGR